MISSALASVAAWWAIKKATTSWLKYALIGGAAALFFTVVGLFAWHISNLSAARDRAVNEAIRERARAEIAMQSFDILSKHQAEIAARMNEFGKLTTDLDAKWSEILNRSNGISSNAPTPQSVSDLNRVSADTRRLLQQLSRIR